jgi:RNA polymerase sigma factor (TIGR02999 family)
MSQVTEMFAAAHRGDREAAETILPLVYDELRRLAAARLSRESGAQSINATALVHEAYLRLVGNGDRPQWEGRRHFFAAAAEAMRRILVESARRRRAFKRDGGRQEHGQDLDQILVPIEQNPTEVLSVSDALDDLSDEDERAAQLVKLRYFAGFTIAECAEILDIAPRTVDLTWAYAKAWLAIRLRNETAPM